ncbi:RACK1 [Symbiodinium microadriaticum]|nr:RACK1 [Symbiodinium microadriaticum]
MDELERLELISTIKEHTDGISSLAFADEDGKRWVSASRDGTVRLWEFPAEKERERFFRDATYASSRVLHGHRGPVSCAAISKDGKHAVSSSWDKTLKYWSLDTGKCLRTFDGHENHVNWVCFSTDEKEFLSASSDRTSSAETPQKLRDEAAAIKRICSHEVGGGSSRCHDDWITAVVHAPSSTKKAKAMTCGWDKQIRVWDCGTRQVLHKLPCSHSAAIHALEISPDASLLASGGRDCAVLLWDVEEGKLLAGLQLAHCINALATQHPEVGTVEVQLVRSRKVHVGRLWWGVLSIVRSRGQYCNRSAASTFGTEELILVSQ